MKYLTIIVAFLTVTFSYAEDIANFKITRVYDGDTFYIDLPCNINVICKDLGVRVYGIDTPEIRTKSKIEKAKAYKAKAEAINFLKNDIKLKDCKRDKYFRLNCEVINSNNKKLSEYLIEKNLAVPYFGEKKTYDWSKKEK